jgi:hypothetical protein
LLANETDRLHYCMYVDILRPTPFPGFMVAVAFETRRTGCERCDSPESGLCWAARPCRIRRAANCVAAVLAKPALQRPALAWLTRDDVEPGVELGEAADALAARVDSDAPPAVLHVLLDDTLLPAVGHVAEVGVVQVVRAHGREALVDDAGIHSLGKFDVIVVRHGVNQEPLFSAAPVSEQLTPFDMPV